MENHAEVERQLEPWRELAGKVVMVTGASSGIGLEFCLDLSKAGCRIIAAARRVDRLKALCDEINGISSDSSNGSTNSSQEFRAVAIELDVSANGAAIEAAVQKAWNAFGHIDVLINNAGIRGSVHSPLNLSEEEWEKIYTTNLRGAWLVTKYVGIHMHATKQGGSVINISSTAGLNRGKLPGSLAYASSKDALNSMTKVMAIELGPYNIRVNSISPGIYKSEITESLIQKDWFKNVALKTIPLRTHGTSNPALTSVVRYLIDDSSEYVSARGASTKFGLRTTRSFVDGTPNRIFSIPRARTRSRDLWLKVKQSHHFITTHVGFFICITINYLCFIFFIW